MNQLLIIFCCTYGLSVAGEVVFSLYFKKGLYNVTDSLINLTLGLLAVVIRIATKGFWLGLWFYLHAFAIFHIEESMWSWTGLFLANEFVYYWFHRLSHEKRFLWAVHVNHHSSQKMNFTTAARVPFLNFIFHNVFWIPLVLVGFHPAMIFAVETLGFLFAFYQHTQMIGKIPVFELMFNTPSHHRVHHASNPEYRNKNFGNVLIVFDRIFGTYKAEDNKIKPVYGLEHNLESHDLITVIFHEWKAIWQNKS